MMSLMWSRIAIGCVESFHDQNPRLVLGMAEGEVEGLLGIEATHKTLDHMPMELINPSNEKYKVSHLRIKIDDLDIDSKRESTEASKGIASSIGDIE